MLCAFSTTYGTFFVAPWEAGNMEPVFLVQSGLACLLIACIVGLIFARTLIVKLPALFANESLDNLWKWVAIVLAAAIAFIIWVTPENPANVMIALLRPKSLAVLLLIFVSPWLLYHFAWVASSRIAETERLNKLTQSMLAINSMDSKGFLSRSNFDINRVIKDTAASFEGTCHTKNIVLDLTSRHYHTDVKLVFVAREENKERVSWLRLSISRPKPGWERSRSRDAAMPNNFRRWASMGRRT
jgi:hypothetical protein